MTPSDRPRRLAHIDYKWIALSNTTLGILMAGLNGSVLMISELRNTYGAEAALRYLARIELPGPAFWAKAENRKASKLLMQNGYLGHRWGEEYLEAASAKSGGVTRFSAASNCRAARRSTMSTR